MAFAARLAQESLSLRFYVRVRGLPYIFTNFAQPSAAGWGSGGGTVSLDSEDYTWSNTLIIGDEFGGMTTESNPKGGIAKSGSLQLDFRTTGTQADSTSDLWLGLLATNVHRTDIKKSILTTSVDVDDTGWAVADASGWGSSGTEELYAGVETVTTDLTTKVGNTFTVTRGRYGSPQRYHDAAISGALRFGGGTWITSVPMAWEGRVVDVWACPGTEDDGTFTPYGTSIDSTEDGVIYRGIVVAHSLSNDLLRARLELADITQLLGREVGVRLPRALAGHSFTSPSRPFIQVDTGSIYMPIQWGKASSATATVGLYSIDLLTLGDSGGALADGLYGTGDIQEAIGYTIADNHPQAGSITEYCNAGLYLNDDGVFQLNLLVAVDATEYEYELTIFPNYASETQRGWTIWRELGFEDTQTQTGLENGGEVSFSFVADRAPAAFRLPLPLSSGNTHTIPGRERLYYREIHESEEDFTASPGWVDDDGNAVGGYVKVGDHEIIKFASVNTDSDHFESHGYLDISAVGSRERFGSRADEEIYIEWSADQSEIERFEIVQGMAFPDTSIERAMLYMLIGGSGVANHNDSTWDKGWRESGVFIDSSLVNITSFTDIDNERNDTRPGLFVAEPVKLRKLLADELVLNQTALVSQYDATNGYQIDLVDITPPSLADFATNTFDSSNVWSLSGTGVSFEIGHQKLINEIRFESAWDHAADKPYLRKSRAIELTSKRTWGNQQALSLKIKSIHYAQDAIERFSRLSQEIFAKYSRPYVLIDFDVTSAEVWTWGLHSAAKLTHTGIPQLDAIGRGVTGLDVRILSRKDKWKSLGEDRVRSRVKVELSTSRGTSFAPSMYLASGSGTSWTASSNKYSASGAAADSTHFADGDYVRVFEVGSEIGVSPAVVVQISTIVGNAITFGSSVSLTAPLIVEQVAYDHANITDTQKAYMYMSDGDQQLDLSSGTAAHMEYS
jgi:hypothetical protein